MSLYRIMYIPKQ